MLPKEIRLTERRLIWQTIKYGHAIRTPLGYFKLKYVKQDKSKPSRLAIIIGKKVAKQANKRQKIKRWFRATVIKHRASLPYNHLIVYIGQKSGQSFNDYEKELQILLKRSHLTNCNHEN